MQVFVQVIFGKTYTIDVEPSNTIEKLKASIYNKTGVPPDKIKLLFHGTELQNVHKLSDYSIQNEATIILCLELNRRVSLFKPGFHLWSNPKRCTSCAPWTVRHPGPLVSRDNTKLEDFIFKEYPDISTVYDLKKELAANSPGRCDRSGPIPIWHIRLFHYCYDPSNQDRDEWKDEYRLRDESRALVEMFLYSAIEDVDASSDGWYARRDAKSGSWYFWHSEKQCWTWEPPLNWQGKATAIIQTDSY